MQFTLLKSKIHRAAVTGASVDYEGSLTISSDLAELVGLLEYEKILVGNLTNGERFETYAIYGEPQRGIIELNGATAHLGKIWRPPHHYELCPPRAGGSCNSSAADSCIGRKERDRPLR
jgi:Aspartate decarboxylase